MNSLLIKICGLTHCEDIRLAVKYGADLIGINMSPRSPRCVNIQEGKILAETVREHGAISVGVFVDENFEEIVSIMKETGLDQVQLHGDISHSTLDEISKLYPTILALSFDCKEEFICSDQIRILFDNSKPGSGEVFSWDALKKKDLPEHWILAGGLNASNILQAVRELKPSCVDVSSGVADFNSDRLRRKDSIKMKEFIGLARGFKYE